jgi:hypothetical protein
MQGSASMGSFGTLNSYGDVDPQKLEGQAGLGFANAGMQIGDMAEQDRIEQTKKNEEGGRYLDKKYGLGDSAEDKKYDELLASEEERSKKNRARFKTRGDTSEDAKSQQIKSAENQSKDKREGSKRKEEDSKAQAELKASLDNLSGKIEANTETQSKNKDKEDQKGGEGGVKAKGEVSAPSKIEFGPIKIDVSVNGSIDQLPDATSQKTVAAIRDAVNQILPGEISRRLGALKT